MKSQKSNRQSSKRKYRSRFKRDLSVRVEPNERDFEIMKALLSSRLLTTSQIAEMFFPSMARARRRLKQLYDGRYLNKTTKKVMVGSGEDLYYLGRVGGQELMAKFPETGDIYQAIIRAESLAKSDNIEHFLWINQFKIALSNACRTNGVEMSQWQYDYNLKLKNKQGKLFSEKVKHPLNNQLLSFAPDGAFILTTNKPNQYFLEADRTTLSNQFRDKMIAYARYFIEGKFSARFKLNGFRVLFIMQKGKIKGRLNIIRNLPPEIFKPLKPEQFIPMFLLADIEDISMDKVLTPIWHNPSLDKASIL